MRFVREFLLFLCPSPLQTQWETWKLLTNLSSKMQQLSRVATYWRGKKNPEMSLVYQLCPHFSASHVKQLCSINSTLTARHVEGSNKRVQRQRIKPWWFKDQVMVSGYRCSEPWSVSTVASRAPLVPLSKLQGWPDCQWLGLITGPSFQKGGEVFPVFFLILAPTLCSVRFSDLAHRFKLLLFGSAQTFSSVAPSSAKAGEALAMAGRGEGAWEAVWRNLFQYMAESKYRELTSTGKPTSTWRWSLVP